MGQASFQLYSFYFPLTWEFFCVCVSRLLVVKGEFCVQANEMRLCK